MSNFDVVEIKSFVPARDFSLALAFYQHIGFELKWNSDDLAYFAAGNASFLLQNFYEPAHAQNFMMHLLVERVEAWHTRIIDSGALEVFDIQLGAVEDRDWGMRDFTLRDPSGVLWRIAQNTEPKVS
ncbi:MAG: VOC family protein [Pseudomonadota bacterium]|nr:VOC family protein [Pseudomonadota bacterium]